MEPLQAKASSVIFYRERPIAWSELPLPYMPAITGGILGSDRCPGGRTMDQLDDDGCSAPLALIAATVF
jgi:hypothetical protein